MIKGKGEHAEGAPDPMVRRALELRGDEHTSHRPRIGNMSTSLLVELFTDHLDGGYAEAARRQKDESPKGRKRATAILAVGVLLLGLTSYVPLFSQGVLGTGAIVAGFALAAMTIGWPIAATTSGRLYLRFGFRTTMLIGSVIAVAGAALLLTVDASSSVLHLAAPNFVMGLGFGYVASPAIIAASADL